MVHALKLQRVEESLWSCAEYLMDHLTHLLVTITDHTEANNSATCFRAWYLPTQRAQQFIQYIKRTAGWKCFLFPIIFSAWLLSLFVCAHFSVQVACSQTYPFRLLIWVDAALSTCCEVAVNLEGVPWATLVWINPVFTCRDEVRQKTVRKREPLHRAVCSLRLTQSLTPCLHVNTTSLVKGQTPLSEWSL